MFTIKPKHAIALAFAGLALLLGGVVVWVKLAGLVATGVGIHAIWRRYRAMECELRSSAAACADASRSREEMLALVAHDLRNPLNLILTTTALFAEIDPPAENRRRLTEAMHRAARSMNRLIEDLLDVARIDSGRLAIDPHEVPALPLVRQTLEMFEQAARDKGVALIADRADPDLYVRADPDRIVQALGNLVSNALKFVDAGGSIRIVCCRQRDIVLVMVRDSGPGLTAHQLEFLFTKFWQGRHNDRRGVGLGLAITRGIVEAHGGRIWAQSVAGRGATFCFTLPAATGIRRHLPGRIDARIAATAESA